MGISDRVPLFKAGATKRNIAVAILYLVLLPFLIIAIPFWLLFAVGTNRNGLGDRIADSPLGALPGIEGGGWKSGIVVFVIAVVVLGGIGAALPSDGSTSATDADINGQNTVEATIDDGSGGESSDTTTESDETTAETTAESTTTVETTEEPSTTTEAAQVDEPDPQSFEGSGSSVESGVDIEGGLVVVELTHNGDSNFQSQLIRDGSDVSYLTNAIGQYNGRVALYAPEGDYQLDIEADGDWTATVRQPRFTEGDVESASGVSSEGQQHDWIGPIEFEGGEVVRVQAEGEGNLAVWLADHRGRQVSLLANDIAPYESETVVTESGTGLLLIETDSANWRIEIEG